jgi:hypothetical protein
MALVWDLCYRISNSNPSKPFGTPVRLRLGTWNSSMEQFTGKAGGQLVLNDPKWPTVPYYLPDLGFGGWNSSLSKEKVKGLWDLGGFRYRHMQGWHIGFGLQPGLMLGCCSSCRQASMVLLEGHWGWMKNWNCFRIAVSCSHGAYSGVWNVQCQGMRWWELHGLSSLS